MVRWNSGAPSSLPALGQPPQGREPRGCAPACRPSRSPLLQAQLTGGDSERPGTARSPLMKSRALHTQDKPVSHWGPCLSSHGLGWVGGVSAGAGPLGAQTWFLGSGDGGGDPTLRTTNTHCSAADSGRGDSGGTHGGRVGASAWSGCEGRLPAPTILILRGYLPQEACPDAPTLGFPEPCASCYTGAPLCPELTQLCPTPRGLCRAGVGPGLGPRGS